MQTWYQLSPPRSLDIAGYVSTVNSHPQRADAPYWVLVLVEKGRRTVRCNGDALRAEAREFLLLPPGSTQEPLETDEHSAYFIHFRAEGTPVGSPEKVDADRLLLPACGKIPADFDVFRHTGYLCRQLVKPYAGQEFCLAQLLSLLHALSLHAQLGETWRSGPSARCESLPDFIETHADAPLRAEDYEAAFGRSYHQLNALFRRRFGCTIKQYHQHARMRRAAALLLEGNSASQTAKLCGYEDYYFFIRCFKKAHGEAPGSYLRRNGLG